MDTKIIKEIVNGLPVTGEKITSIKDGYAIYSSGGKIQIDSSTRLKIGDTVTGVYHGHDTKNGQPIIYVNVDHLLGDPVTNDTYYSEYLKINRNYKLTELFDDGNN